MHGEEPQPKVQVKSCPSKLFTHAVQGYPPVDELVQPPPAELTLVQTPFVFCACPNAKKRDKKNKSIVKFPTKVE